MYLADRDTVKGPRAVLDRLTDLACYAAQGCKVQQR
jgi:hypothetical protein